MLDKESKLIYVAHCTYKLGLAYFSSIVSPVMEYEFVCFRCQAVSLVRHGLVGNADCLPFSELEPSPFPTRWQSAVLSWKTNEHFGQASYKVILKDKQLVKTVSWECTLHSQTLNAMWRWLASFEIRFFFEIIVTLRAKQLLYEVIRKLLVIWRTLLNRLTSNNYKHNIIDGPVDLIS